MLFQDVSCIAENTMHRNKDNGIYDLLEIDWVSIVSLSKKLKVKIDSSMDLSNIGDKIPLEFLKENKKILTEQNYEFKTFENKSGYFAVMPIRKTETYVVFFLYYRKEAPMSNKDLKWASLYTNKSYTSILLNNELIQNHDYMQNVFDSTESAIIVFDLNFNIVSYNKSADKILGNTKSTNLSICDLSMADNKKFMSDINDVSKSHNKKHLDKVYFSGKNKNCIFTFTLSPLRNSKEQVVGVVAVGSDITAAQLMEYKFEQISRYGLLGEISLGLSHDVKNPLMNIRGCASLLKKKAFLDDKNDELLRIIIQEVDRINNIIEQMMSFGNAAKANDYAMLSINEALHNCIQIIERQKLYRQIEIKSDLQKNIPFVKAKNTDIQQIFINILINSLQAIDQNGVITITSEFDEIHNAIYVYISDTGKGIDDIDKSRLFSPYYSTKPNGTGLGLFVVKRVLEIYNGVLEIESKPSIGTTCKISFPCADNS